MDLNLSGDALAYTIGGVLTAFCTLGAWGLHNKDVAQEKEIKNIRDGLDQQVRAVGGSLEAAWKKIDALREEKANYWTRADHERWFSDIRCENAELRKEIKEDINNLADRFTLEIKGIWDRFSMELNRIFLAKTKHDEERS